MNLEFLTDSESFSQNREAHTASQSTVNRMLRWFEREGDDLVGEKIISNVNLEHLQELFGIDSKNLMYDCYPVKSVEQINYLQNLLDFRIDTNSYDYFIECDIVEPTSTSTISIRYRICLLINLEGDSSKGGYLIVDEFDESPKLNKDDKFYIRDWKVGYSNSQDIVNLSFDFEVQVMSIQKTLVRHNHLLEEIFVESPNREEIKKLVDALRERNPDAIKLQANS